MADVTKMQSNAHLLNAATKALKQVDVRSVPKALRDTVKELKLVTAAAAQDLQKVIDSK